MKPAVTDPGRPARPPSADPFPREVRVVRARRRTIELTLHEGRLVAYVPRRISQRELQQALPPLRAALWRQLRSRSIFDDGALQQRAQRVAATHLADQQLPPFIVRFSTRQQKRWGSCTVGRGRGGRLEGSIRISARLRGHPAWLLDHLLLHELAHLVVIDHGPRFQNLMRRSPQYERAEGYLEALVHLEQLGALEATPDAPAVDAACRPPSPAAGSCAPGLAPADVPLPLFAALEAQEAAAIATAPVPRAPRLRRRRGMSA